MQKSKNLKILAVILCAAMIAAMTLLTSCGGKTVGTGKTSFKLEITKADGTKTVYTVKTDDLTIGDALASAALIPADTKTANKGMINTLDGTTLDYNATQQYWGFYIDGAFATAGAFDTAIESGKTYAFKVEKYVAPSDTGNGASTTAAAVK